MGLARIGAPGMGSQEPTAGQTGDGTGTGAGPDAGSTGAGRAAAARQPTSETATSAADREGVGGGGPPGRSTVASDGPDAGAAVGKAVGCGAGLAGCGFAEPNAFFELAESEADCFPRPASAAKAKQTIRGRLLILKRT
jgi:hypothetical protein